jgi:hypothetical protein
MTQLGAILVAGLLALPLILVSGAFDRAAAVSKAECHLRYQSVATLAAPTTITASAPARGGSRIVYGKRASSELRPALSFKDFRTRFGVERHAKVGPCCCSSTGADGLALSRRVEAGGVGDELL